MTSPIPRGLSNFGVPAGARLFYNRKAEAKTGDIVCCTQNRNKYIGYVAGRWVLCLDCPRLLSRVKVVAVITYENPQDQKP